MQFPVQQSPTIFINYLTLNFKKILELIWIGMHGMISVLILRVFTFVKEKLMCHRIHEESETSATISDNVRSKEDLEMYKLFWPNVIIANALMFFYKDSQKSNFK